MATQSLGPEINIQLPVGCSEDLFSGLTKLLSNLRTARNVQVYASTNDSGKFSHGLSQLRLIFG